jgi:hypothetical protein
VPPAERGKAVVERTLFGWQLRLGRETISELTEEGARYLRIFVEMGFTEVPVPSETGHLAAVLPDLERAFDSALRHIEARTAGILNSGTREMATDLIWEEVRRRLLPAIEAEDDAAHSVEADVAVESSKSLNPVSVDA